MSDDEAQRHHHPHPPPRITTLTFSWSRTIEVPLTPDERKVYIHMADLTLRDSDAPETASLALTDAHGSPTTPDSPPVWASDDGGAVITLTPSADGMSADATPVAPGAATVTITLTDTDGTVVIGTSVVTVTAGEATGLEVSWAPIAVAPVDPGTDPTPLDNPPGA